MDLFTLLLLSTALAPVTCSPLGSPEAAHRASNQPLFGQGGAAGAALTPQPTPIAGDNFPLTQAPSPTPLASGRDEEMKPLRRREALNIEGLSPPQDSVVLYPVPSAGCTTTISETYEGDPCFWDGTLRVYPATTVLYQQVDCNGCDSVYVHKDIFFCPNQKVNATLALDVPSTYWSTICQLPTAVSGFADAATPATATAPLTTNTPQLPTLAPVRTPPAIPFRTLTAGTGTETDVTIALGARSPQDDSFDKAAWCTTTLVVEPAESAGLTATRYASYSTSTETLKCGGCALAVSTALAGYGPPGAFLTTTTAPVGTVTAYACGR